MGRGGHYCGGEELGKRGIGEVGTFVTSRWLDMKRH